MTVDVVFTAAVVWLVVLAAISIPVPYRTRAEGVVWVPDDARIRARTNGFVTGVLTPENGLVVPDQPLVELEDPFLLAQVQVLEAQLEELHTEAWGEGPPRPYGPVLKQSLAYVGAFQGDRLVGFVNVTWDLFLGFNYDAWDTHTNNFRSLKDRLVPKVDQALAAMIEEGAIPERSIGDPSAHRAILEELDEVAAGRGQTAPIK